MTDREITLSLDGAEVTGELAVPEGSTGIVVFAHGSGSSRHSPRNQQVAARLRGDGSATLLMDLLTRDEDAVDRRTREHRFDIDLLAERLVSATRWLHQQPPTHGLPIGYFGASTGAAAALVAAAQLGDDVAAVVSRGGRPDLAGDMLTRVTAPTLLIIGGEDAAVLPLNEEARSMLGGLARMEIVPGATHLFEEPGALEQVGDLAAAWFAQHFGAAA